MPGLLQVPLFPDELLASYVARVARANGVRSSRFLCADLEVDYVGMVNGDEKQLRRLAHALGKSFEELRRHSVELLPNKSVVIANEVFEAPGVKRGILRYCPKCFAEDELNPGRMPGTRRYRRAHWLVEGLNTCIPHSWTLVELEGHHERREDFYELLVGREHEIAAKNASSKMRVPNALEIFIHERMTGQRCHGELLDQTPLHIAISISRLFGVAEIHGKNIKIGGLSDTELSSATSAGFAVVLAGPAAIFACLDDIVRQKSKNGRGGIFEKYGILYTMLRRRPGSRYDTFASIVEQHAGETMPLRRSTRPPIARSFTTVSEIARETGLSHEVVRRRLSDADLWGKEAGASIPFYAKEIFAGSSRKLVKNKRAAEILGGDKDLVDILDAAGLLRRANMANDRLDSNRRRRPQADYVEEEVLLLRQGVYGKVNSSSRQGLMSLREVARRHELLKTTVIAKLINGDYKTVARKGVDALLDDIMLDPLEVDPTDGKFVSVETAASLADIELKSFRKLITHGIIQSTKRQAEGQYSPRTLVSTKDIESFNKLYVSVRRISAATGLAQLKVAARIKSENVELAFSPNDVKCWIITRANFAALFGIQDAVREP